MSFTPDTRVHQDGGSLEILPAKNFISGEDVVIGAEPYHGVTR